MVDASQTDPTSYLYANIVLIDKQHYLITFSNMYFEVDYELLDKACTP
jgi:hypothetical protein